MKPNPCLNALYPSCGSCLASGRIDSRFKDGLDKNYSGAS